MVSDEVAPDDAHPVAEGTARRLRATAAPSAPKSFRFEVR